MVAVHVHGQLTAAGTERKAVVPWLFATPSQLSSGISWSDSSEHRLPPSSWAIPWPLANGVADVWAKPQSLQQTAS